MLTTARAVILRHWLDVLIIALPLLRPLQLASLLAVLDRHAASGLRRKSPSTFVGESSLLAFCAALAIFDAERRNPDANITSSAMACGGPLLRGP
jgi:voltage-gated potassium channel